MSGGLNLGSSAPWWWATLVGGAGLFAQAVRAIYKDWTAARTAKIAAVDKAAADKETALTSRISVLEGQVATTHAAHLADVSKLLTEAIAREHGVTLAMDAITELPSLQREEMAALRSYLVQEREGTRSMLVEVMRPVMAEVLRPVLADLLRQERADHREDLVRALTRALETSRPPDPPAPIQGNGTRPATIPPRGRRT